MTAEVTTAVEAFTDKPCQVGRIVYTVGLRRYVALTFRYLEEPYAWVLTWVGEEGTEPACLPLEWGVTPPDPMLAALSEATE